MTKPTRRGGRRAGAGRPSGRTATSATITLANETWAKIDSERGPRSRSKYIEERVSAPQPPKNPAN
jgi:hypothetical protein